MKKLRQKDSRFKRFKDSKDFFVCFFLKKKVILRQKDQNMLGPILGFKGSIQHIQKEHPTMVTQIDLILQI